MLASFLFFFWFDRDLCAVMACWCAGCCGLYASVTAEEVAFRKYTRLAEEEREARREGREGRKHDAARRAGESLRAGGPEGECEAGDCERERGGRGVGRLTE